MKRKRPRSEQEAGSTEKVEPAFSRARAAVSGGAARRAGLERAELIEILDALLQHETADDQR